MKLIARPSFSAVSIGQLADQYRGRDLPFTPVMHAYALYHRENGLILLAEPGVGGGDGG